MQGMQSTPGTDVTSGGSSALAEVASVVEVGSLDLATRVTIAPGVASQPLRTPRGERAWIEAIYTGALHPLALVLDAALVAAVARLLSPRPAVVVTTVGLYFVAAFATRLYRPRTPAECQGVSWYARAVTAPALVTGPLLWVLPLVHTEVPTSATLAGGIALALVLFRAVLWNVLAIARRRGHCLRPTLVVGTTSAITRLQNRLVTFPEAGLRFDRGYDPSSTEGGEGVQGGLSHLDPAVRAAKHVIVVADDLEREMVRKVVTNCWWERRSVTVVLPISPIFLPYRGCARIGDLAVLSLPYGGPGLAWQVAKRAFDIVVSAILLVVLAPLFALVALAIWAEDRGPALYRQARVGREGRSFTIWKFRSMVPGAESGNGELAQQNVTTGLLFKIENDPRVTKVGAIIRRFSVDELPQLVNVLHGDMSIVGPRPLPVDPHAFDERATRRHLVRPGLTGLWQVEGANALSYEDMVELDLAYVARWSMSLDLWLLARTLSAVLVRRSAF
jgi:exopolysaccharide biosynthesis polyprenyl glycosylphosphotransferase